MPAWKGRVDAAAIAFVALWFALALPATAATDIESRRQQLFQIMLDQPDNLDVAFEYAALSTQAGDLEGAISTLERMLIFAPGLPRLQLELGVLYFRLGSMETARSYLEAAIATPGAPPEVISKVQVYLAAIEQNLDPTTFSGAVYAGIRWQSNANAAPDASEVILNGLPFVLSEEAVEQSDYAIFSTGSVSYRHDLENQGDRLDFDAVTYAAFQFEQTQLNTQLVEATLGPTFNLGRVGVENGWFGLYGIGNGALLDEEAYFATAGAGAKLALRPDVQTDLLFRGEYRHRWFHDTDDRPTSSLRTGNEYRAVAAINYLLNSKVRIFAAGRLTREDVEAGFYDNWEYGGLAGATVLFDSPLPALEYPWALNVGGGYLWRDYDDPDPTINAQESENDKEYWINGALNIPLREWLALMPQVEYRNQSSNYPTRDYDVLTISVGLYAKF